MTKIASYTVSGMVLEEAIRAIEHSLIKCNRYKLDTMKGTYYKLNTLVNLEYQLSLEVWRSDEEYKEVYEIMQTLEKVRDWVFQYNSYLWLYEEGRVARLKADEILNNEILPLKEKLVKAYRETQDIEWG